MCALRGQDSSEVAALHNNKYCDEMKAQLLLRRLVREGWGKDGQCMAVLDYLVVREGVLE